MDESVEEYKLNKNIILKNSKKALNLYDINRINGHKKLFIDSNIPFDKYLFENDKYTDYDFVKWINEDNNLFCEYTDIQNTKMVPIMMSAVQSLQKHVFPPLNLDPSSSYTINDNLNEFVKYSLSSRVTTQRINTSNNASIKIDFWIIPQFSRCSKNDHVFELNRILNDDNYYSFNGLAKMVNNKQIKCELIKKILPKKFDDDMNDYGGLDSIISAQCATIIDTEIIDYDILFDSTFINDYIDYIPPHLIDLIKKDHKFVVSPLWDLQHHLKKAGYVENKDYWFQYAKDNVIKLQQQLYEMWRNANNNNNNRYNRYIFIVDRRNPENLKNNNMEYKKTNYNKTSKDWRDKILLIPIQSKKSKFCLFQISDTLNGYKFVLSYTSKTRWYIDDGATNFALNHMEWLWTRYFVKINKNEQKLNKENIKLLKQIK